MKNTIQKVTTAGAVVKNNKILVVKRASDDDSYPNLWELPSGKKEPLEKVTDSVVREVFEETGLRVKVLDTIFSFNFSIEKENEIKDFTQIIFAVETVGETQVELSGEHQDYKWIAESELDSLNISEETKEGIKKAFNYSRSLR